MRKRIFGFSAAIICGVALYLGGYASGEMKQYNANAKMYTQGYHTGYIKGFRRFRTELVQHPKFDRETVNPYDIGLTLRSNDRP